MDSKEIQELLKLVNRLELAEFKYRQGEVEFSVKTKYYHKSRSGFDSAPQMMQMPPVSQPQQTTSPSQQPQGSRPSTETENGGASATPSTGAKENLVEIRSPIVGTFYRSA